MQITSDANLGAGSGVSNIVLAGGSTLSANATFTLNSARGITLGAAAGDGGVLDATAGNTLTYNGVLADNGLGAGNFFKGNGLGTVILGGANTFTGSTNVSGGTLKLAGSLASTYTTSEQYLEQLRQMVHSWLQQGRLPAAQYPRFYQIAVNQQVASSLGLKLADEKTLYEQMPNQVGECGDGC